MSGSNEELPTAPDEAVESGPAAEVEMTAAEALAQATRAAAGETQDGASAKETRPEPDDEAESPETKVGEDATKEAPQPPDSPPEPEPAEAAAEPEPAEAAAAPQPAEAAAEPQPAEAAAEPQPAEAAAAPQPAAAAAEPQPAEAAAEPEPAEVAAEPQPAEVATEPDAEKPAPAPADRPELRPVREAIANRESLEGRVIGWNNGGFHLALGELSAFCPRSEMELGEIEDPESYLDRTFLFRVLRLQGKGRRIVVSRAAHLRNELSRQRNELRKKLRIGAVIEGTVASLKDFGAFVELGGAQGLVHVSEISHRRVEHPGDVLSEGQQVQVKVLKVEQGGRRISLSIRALEPDPWKDLADRFPQGAVVKGTVEKANQIGAFIELAPGLTGLLPAKSMPIPRETTPARAYPPGKEVSVQIVSIDPRRQRISLALEGSGLEGSRSDYKEYQRHAAGESGGFNALASAFRRIRDEAD